MTKTVNCSKVDPNCTFMVRSDSDDELISIVQKHAKDKHSMNVTREQVMQLAE